MLTALKPSLEHDRKHVVRLLRSVHTIRFLDPIIFSCIVLAHRNVDLRR